MGTRALAGPSIATLNDGAVAMSSGAEAVR